MLVRVKTWNKEKKSDKSNPNVTVQSEISEYQEKEDVICRLQSETKKYLWFSIDKNLVHSAIVSWDFWESIGGKINSQTTNGQSENRKFYKTKDKECQFIGNSF